MNLSVVLALALSFLKPGCLALGSECQGEIIPDEPLPRTEEELKVAELIEKNLNATWVASEEKPSIPRGFTKLKNTENVNRAFSSNSTEYRMMTLRQMKRFHQCLAKMKASGIYDIMTALHSQDEAPAAHGGAAFLPWHRYFLLLFEDKLRSLQGCNKAFLPYWDSSLDQLLPNPEDSVLWTHKFWGSHTGTVMNGQLCKKWKISDNCQMYGNFVRRDVRNRDRIFNLYSRKSILKLFAARTSTEFMTNEDGLGMSLFEDAHGRVHCFVGGCCSNCQGHMGDVTCSTNDPVFYMHHKFVDLLWEEWKWLRGNGGYPKPGQDGATRRNIGGRNHMASRRMLPFQGLRNSDYFNSRINYEERISTSKCFDDEDCYSPQNLLVCVPRYFLKTKSPEVHRNESTDLTTTEITTIFCPIEEIGGVCASKIRKGGNCTGLFDGVCYCPRKARKVEIPRCLQGKCTCEYHDFFAI